MAGKSYFFSKPTNRLFSIGLEKEHPPISDAPMFEFDESELWNTHPSQFESRKTIPSYRNSKKSMKKAEGSSGGRDHATGSLPVNIPDWSKMGHPRRVVEGETSDEEDDVRIPPHEFLAKQLERTRIASFSLHEGVGRTLKGRDLSRVRNAIWEKTGFQD
ncbi:hypothetical protein MRB53_004168 [Persea americana]|uniref:Uncharacterized protein n=1 Tax=Persea americana TaxID=3435 RepID=A0ACC2MZF7_PERAE|nr:hypothetical protein MRB53_004168 [Persea americana]|eukprot:TRINITY_DN16652_c0_g1_i1.p1 TRINITY_DN16652_c0_g1~~TRINITY_DN16652_c0_g1_i1.p1  ORF type:complete len:160 (+),score=28.43 TRINITY_DN16652_c0_g1_i1:103-582(+)